ncbi:hypothetical protein JCM3766R1_006361 [Sporobolomyces carnicolor]
MTASPLDASPVASTSTAPPRVRRKAPQLLADELVAEELIAGAPSRNGGRKLTDDRDPWTHNAWDQVEWDPELEQFAVEAVERQRQSPVPQELQDKLNANPAAQWDQFYAHNKDNFFKERAWLQNEFPELEAVLQRDAGPKRVVEIGCGNGSTLFPLLAANENPHLRLHGFDYSKEAVNVVRSSASFDPAHLSCDVWDLASRDGIPENVAPSSVDVVSMIFVLSALHPNEWEQAVRNVYTMLKPGGVLLFRDYGRNDLAQLRFKAGRYMQDGLYVRGDNTRVYFFERDELVAIFGRVRTSSSKASPSLAADEAATDSVTTTTTTTSVATDGDDTPVSGSTTPLEAPSSATTATTKGAGAATKEEKEEDEGDVGQAKVQAVADSLHGCNVAVDAIAPESKLDLLQLGVDRRMILNRKRQLKMMRVWLQGRWRKPCDKAEEACP